VEQGRALRSSVPRSAQADWVQFAARYGDQAELDHAALLTAIADGRLAAETEPRTGPD
jgi:hypothetical protein